MPYDLLTVPVLTYIKELVEDSMKLGSPIYISEGSEWFTDADGNVRKKRIERASFGFHWAKHKSTSTNYALAVKAIEEDPIFGESVDAMIGNEGGQTRFDCDSVIQYSMAGIAKLDGTFSLTKKVVSSRLAELRRFLAEPMMPDTLIIPLPGIKCYQVPFVIDEGIEIDKLSAKEVGWSIESGALRLFNNAVPFVQAEHCMGIRIKIASTRKIIKPADSPSNSDDWLHFVNNEMNRSHKFGSVTRWKIADCVEDLLFVLRLARPDFIGTSGAVLVSEQPMSRSSTWIGRPTRNFVITNYEIDRDTGRAIRSYWRNMKEQSGKRHSLPSICVRRFNAAMDRVSLDDAVVDLMIAAEALFLYGIASPMERGEMGLRLSLRAAKLLEVEPTKRQAMYKFMKFAYSERSHVAHGGSYKAVVSMPGRGAKVPLNEFVDELSSVMRRALQTAIPLYRKDPTFGTGDYWDSLVLRK